jgi:hypothetical protein
MLSDLIDLEEPIRPTKISRTTYKYGIIIYVLLLSQS